MQQTVEFQIEPLPGSGIWTGSDDPKKMNLLKGTSLVGSMRFWTEALLRSFEHRVCDCVQDHETFDKDHYMGGGDGNVCSACHSFGCTGLARAFSLHINTKQPLSLQLKKANIKISAPNRGDTYYSLATGWTEKFSLTLSCQRALSWPCDEHRKKNHYVLPPEVVLATFIMLEYGTLGAMDQYGCGLVQTPNRKELVDTIQSALGSMHTGVMKPEPGQANLKDFYFFKGSLDNTALNELCNCTISRESLRQEGAPVAAASIIRIRRLLRDTLRSQFTNLSTGKELRHWLCGYIQKSNNAKNLGSHISVSVSNGTLYGWGWVPRTGIVLTKDERVQNSLDERETILQAIHSCIKSFCPSIEWREFQSVRDKNSPQDWQQYLRDMIARPWRKAS